MQRWNSISGFFPDWMWWPPFHVSCPSLWEGTSKLHWAHTDYWPVSSPEWIWRWILQHLWYKFLFYLVSLFQLTRCMGCNQQRTRDARDLERLNKWANRGTFFCYISVLFRSFYFVSVVSVVSRFSLRFSHRFGSQFSSAFLFHVCSLVFSLVLISYLGLQKYFYVLTLGRACAYTPQKSRKSYQGRFKVLLWEK